MRVDEGFKPGAVLTILDLQNVGEHGGVVLLNDVLDGRRMSVVFSSEGVLRDRHGLLERQRWLGRSDGGFTSSVRRGELGAGKASRTGSDERRAECDDFPATAECDVGDCVGEWDAFVVLAQVRVRDVIGGVAGAEENRALIDA